MRIPPKEVSAVYDQLTNLTNAFQEAANAASAFEERTTMRAEERGVPLAGREILRRNTEQAQLRADDFAEATRLVCLYVTDTSHGSTPLLHPDPRLNHPSAQTHTPPDAGEPEH